MIRQKISPCLWFDDNGEEAARFYASLFEDSAIGAITRFVDGAHRPAGSVMTVEFRLAGLRFVALNGGPHFTFSEAVSMSVECETQDEVDRLWAALGDGGQPGPCGWIKDRFGLSWQIVPVAIVEMMGDPDAIRVKRVVDAMMTMGKLDIAALRRAYES
jgi:predicted 3-demethylubiquinone-9 3-methyltransferase (glyoxalase superfamily)